MAKDVRIQEFRVQPVEDNGRLAALTIQPTVKIKRVSQDGKVLSWGWAEDDGEPITVPIKNLADLIRELVDWPTYFASGEYEHDNQGGY